MIRSGVFFCCSTKRVVVGFGLLEVTSMFGLTYCKRHFGIMFYFCGAPGTIIIGSRCYLSFWLLAWYVTGVA